MTSALIYLLQSLADLYLLTFALRLAMQWVRADYRNPIVSFVVKVTDPLVKPLKKVLPAIYKIDTATLVVFLLINWGLLALLASMACVAMPNSLSLFGLAAVRGVGILLNMYFFVIFGYVLMSWIAGASGQNPSLVVLSNALGSLAIPVLRPIQRLIPPIAGLDLTPIFVLLLLGALQQMLLPAAQSLVSSLNCPLQMLI